MASCGTGENRKNADSKSTLPCSSGARTSNCSPASNFQAMKRSIAWRSSRSPRPNSPRRLSSAHNACAEPSLGERAINA